MTELVESVGKFASSFDAIPVSELTFGPEYTPSRVSKSDPSVVTVASPLVGAVQRYQTDAPPWFPA